jgi:hypothetical protein
MLALASASLLAISSISYAQTDDELIASAASAAPGPVGENATVVAMDEQMNIRTVREGTNGFTCMPDNPGSPGNDPMCFDAGGLQWAQAWLAHETPPEGVVGMAYMLQGGSDASNTDPHAMAPAEGAEWVDTGPHIMLFNVGDMIGTYPAQGDSPDTHAPYVMWADTPYEHLMIPVE